MLYFSQGEVESINGSERHRCSICEKRIAAWKARKSGESEPSTLCGWCLLYGGSEWGDANRDEIVRVGTLCRETALASSSAKTQVPHLDARHRLLPIDAEKFVLGVHFTSNIVARKMASLGRRLGGP